MNSIQETISAWQGYLDTLGEWEQLVEGTKPKPTGCGPVYELPNPIDRPGEDLAIADMRKLEIAEPHYHPTGVTEIYFCLQGLGLVVVGGEEQRVEKGSVVVMPENTVHFTVPENDLVFAVVNTPPFKPEDYIKIDLAASNEALGFDAKQFERLTT